MLTAIHLRLLQFTYMLLIQAINITVTRDCNHRIPDRFSIRKSQDYERPNSEISGLENNVSLSNNPYLVRLTGT